MGQVLSVIYLSEIETRPAPETCHVVRLPTVLHSSALVPNRAMSTMTTLIHIDLWNIIFKRRPEVHITHGKAPWRWEYNNRRTISVHTRLVATSQINCWLIPISVPLGSDN